MSAEIEAGWMLLQISAAAWIFYAGSRAVDWYRARHDKQRGMLAFIQRVAVPRDTRRV